MSDSSFHEKGSFGRSGDFEEEAKVSSSFLHDPSSTSSENSELDCIKAEHVANSKLARTIMVKQLGIKDGSPISMAEVNDHDLDECFGKAVGALFKHMRIVMLWLVCQIAISSLLIVTLLTSLRQPISSEIVDFWEILTLQLQRFTLSQCFVDKCDNMLETALFADIGGCLLAFLFCKWLERATRHRKLGKLKKTFESAEVELSSHSLFVVQAPHMADSLTKRDAHRYIKQRAEESTRKRNNLLSRIIFSRPKISRIPTVSGLVNYSKYDFEFISQAERKLKLEQELKYLKAALKETNSMQKDFHEIRSKQNRVLEQLENIEKGFFADFFLKKELGAARASAEFVFIKFDSPEDACLAKILMHHDRRHWIHHFAALMLGAPITRFRVLGSFDEIYPSNINFPKLQRPFLFAQTGWPARIWVMLVVFLLGWSTTGFFAWDAASKISPFWGGIFLFAWRKTSERVLIPIISFIGHPLRTSHFHFSQMFMIFGFEIPCFTMWPLSWSPFSLAFTRKWWLERMTVSIVSAEVCHTAFTLLFYCGGRFFLQGIQNLLTPRARTQAELERKHLPKSWDSLSVFTSFARICFVSTMLGSVIPALLPLSILQIFTTYIAEKSHLLNWAGFEHKLEARKIALFIVQTCEIGTFLRLLVTISTLFQNYERGSASPFAKLELLGFGLSTATLGYLVLGTIMATVFMHRCEFVSRFSYNLFSVCGLLHLPFRHYQELRKPAYRVHDADGRSPEEKLRDIDVFDFKQGPKYGELFQKIESLNDLQRWQPLLTAKEFFELEKSTVGEKSVLSSPSPDSDDREESSSQDKPMTMSEVSD